MARFRFLRRGEEKREEGDEEKKREKDGTRFLFEFRGETQVSSLTVYSSPSDRDGLPTDVRASPRRAGFERWVRVGRNPSAHMSFRGGGWCLQIRLLSHSEDIQNVRWSVFCESLA